MREYKHNKRGTYMTRITCPNCGRSSKWRKVDKRPRYVLFRPDICECGTELNTTTAIY